MSQPPPAQPPPPPPSPAGTGQPTVWAGQPPVWTGQPPSWGGGPPSGQASQRRRWVLPVIIGGTALVILLGAVAIHLFLGFLAGDEYFLTVGPEGDLEEVTLEVGDCADTDPFEASRLDDAALVPCSGRHLLEVAAREPLAGPTAVLQARSPREDAVLDVSERFCLAEFERYVDAPYLDSDLDVITLLPDEGRWSAGEREVICLVVPWWDDDLIGPARGSRR